MDLHEVKTDEKKIKNDYTYPSYISIIANVNLTQKSFYVRPVEMTLIVRKQFEITIGKLKHVRKPKY